MPSQHADKNSSNCKGIFFPSRLEPQFMNSPWVAECVGVRHIGHWRICWHRWQSQQITWPQGTNATAGRCSWQMGQSMRVPPGIGSSTRQAATSSASQLAVRSSNLHNPACSEYGFPTPLGNPSSAICSLNFCSTSSWPPSRLQKKWTLMVHLQWFRRFSAAWLHCCMNSCIFACTKLLTSCSVFTL